MKTKFKSNGAPFVIHSPVELRLTLFTVLWLATLASTRVPAAEFNSGIINFDHSDPEIGYPAYGPGPAAIGSAGDLWNTVSMTYYGGEPKGPLSLYNTNGTSTSVEWSLLSGGGISDPTIGGTYGRLFDVSVHFYSATITGLTPNQQFNLYLYSVLDWDEVISVNGVDFTTYGIHQSAIVNSLTAGSQYDVHTVTADSLGTLAFVPISAHFGPYISSWQLTPVPEPSSITLALVGAIILFAYTWQWRKHMA